MKSLFWALGTSLLKEVCIFVFYDHNLVQIVRNDISAAPYDMDYIW